MYRVLSKHYRPIPGGTGPSWLSFIGHTTDSLWSVDLFRCESIVLRSDWVLVVMDQFTRRLVGVGVHRGPVNGADLCRMFNAAIHGRGAPRHLSTDHDPLFEAHRWTANLRILEIDEIKTVPHVPRSHPFVERLIGTTRREFLDHVLFWNARDLERKLGDFQGYYNEVRSHASLKGRTPLTFAGGHMVARAELNNVRWGLPLPGLGPAPSGGLTTNSRGHPHRHIAASNEDLVVGRPVRHAVLRLLRGMNLRLHPTQCGSCRGSREMRAKPPHPQKVFMQQRPSAHSPQQARSPCWRRSRPASAWAGPAACRPCHTAPHPPHARPTAAPRRAIPSGSFAQGDNTVLAERFSSRPRACNTASRRCSSFMRTVARRGRSGDGGQSFPRDRVAARDVNATSVLLLDGVSDEKEDRVATWDMGGGNICVMVRRMQDDMRPLQAFTIAVTLVVAYLFGGVLSTAPVFY